MRKIKLLSLPIVVCLSLLGPLYGAAFEPQGMGARAQGMGGVFVAVADGSEDVYWNPAGLAYLHQPGITLSHKDLFGLGLLQYNAFSFVQPYLERGGMGFMASQLSTTGEAGFLDYQENTYIFSYGYSLVANFFIGASGKYYGVESEIKAGGLGADLALLKSFSHDQFLFGVLAQDVNQPNLRWDTGTIDKLPANLRAGAVYYFYDHNLVSLELDRLLEKNIEPHFGVESWFLEKIAALRLGGFKQRFGINYSLGLGLRFKKVQLDYAWERHHKLGDTNTFSLSLIW
ncbi:MAG: hypothetical protein ABII74_00065 [Elusimicrobiota bacterium]